MDMYACTYNTTCTYILYILQVRIYVRTPKIRHLAYSVRTYVCTQKRSKHTYVHTYVHTVYGWAVNASNRAECCVSTIIVANVSCVSLVGHSHAICNLFNNTIMHMQTNANTCTVYVYVRMYVHMHVLLRTYLPFGCFVGKRDLLTTP